MRINESLFRQWLDAIISGSPVDALLDAHAELVDAVAVLLSGGRVYLLDDAGEVVSAVYQDGDDIVIDENVGPETD